MTVAKLMAELKKMPKSYTIRTESYDDYHTKAVRVRVIRMKETTQDALPLPYVLIE